jgi:microcystin-dependent protein
MSLYQGENKIASNAIVGDTLPIGSMVPYPSDTIPDNWLLCDGQAVNRTTYSLLFAVLGISHGSGDGSTTFNLPNIKGKTIVGRDSADTDFDVLGENRGSKTQTLSVANLPAHNHNFASSTGKQVITGTPGGYTDAVNDYLAVSVGITAGSDNRLQIGFIGSGTAHNNIQPSIVENYIIKAKQSVGLIATVKDNLTSTSPTDALSANQGRVLDNKYTRHVMTASTSGRPVINATVAFTPVIIPLDTSVSSGTLLTFNNASDRIVIGTGVTKVKVSARCTIWSSPGVTNETDFFIQKNGASVAEGFQNRVAGQGFNDYAITEKLISVVAGEYIQISFNSNLTGNYTILSDGLACYLTVEVVE